MDSAPARGPEALPPPAAAEPGLPQSPAPWPSPDPGRGCRPAGEGPTLPSRACLQSVGLHYRFPAFARGERAPEDRGGGVSVRELEPGACLGRPALPVPSEPPRPGPSPFPSFWPHARAPISHLAGAHTFLLPTLPLEFSPTWTSHSSPPPLAHSLVLSFICKS